jgi:hypothetical protein
MLMHGTKYQQCSFFVLGLGVLKLFITLNSYDWLRVHSVLDSISMVHQSSSNVCGLLLKLLHYNCSLIDADGYTCRQSQPSKSLKSLYQ